MTQRHELSAWTIFYDTAGVRTVEDIPSAATWNKIRVPSVWQEINPDHDGVAWYRCAHRFTANDLTQHQRIHFGAVHYQCSVFCNGILLGSHEGGYTPFSFALDDALHTGKNDISVRVLCPPRDREIEGFRVGSPLQQSNIPTWKAGWYYPFGGLWQAVHIDSSPRVYAQDTFVRPSIAPQGIRCTSQLTNVSGKIEQTDVRWSVTAWSADGAQGKALASGQQSLRVGTRGCDIDIATDLPTAQLWDCDHPNLYVLTIETHSSHGIDVNSTRFGLREFRTDGTYFYLNNKRIILRGTLHQGVFPKHIAAPHNDDMARRDLELIKEAHGNFVRLHIKPAPAFQLDIADEIGLLCMEEPPIGWITYDDQVVARAVHNVQGMIKRDRNHPSVVMWCLFNELCDSIYTSHKADHTLIRPCADAALALDDSRLLIDKSGHDRVVKIGALANGIRSPGKKKPYAIVDEHPYKRIPVKSESVHELCRLGAGKKGLLFASEYGTSSFPDMDAVINGYSKKEQKLGLREYRQMKNYRDGLVDGFTTFNLKKRFGTLSTFYTALQYDHCQSIDTIQRTIRSNQRLSGYVITQHADAASEFGGMVDLWRTPKDVYTVFSDCNAEQLLTVSTTEPSVYSNKKMQLRVVLSDLSEHAVTVTGEVLVKRGKKTVERIPFSATGDLATRCLQHTISLKQAGTYTIEASATLTHTPSAAATAKTTQTTQTTKRTSQKKIQVQHQCELVVIEPSTSTEPIYICANDGIRHVKPELETHCRKQGYSCQMLANQCNDLTIPVIAQFRNRSHCHQQTEMQNVLRDFVERGGSAIILDSDLAHMPHFFQHAMREQYGVGSYAGNSGFALEDGYFAHTGTHGHLGQNYAHGYPRIHTPMNDIIEHGYQPLSVHVVPGQFGHPDTINWGCSAFTGSFGKGRFWVLQAHTEEYFSNNPIISNDLAQLVIRAREHAAQATV